MSRSRSNIAEVTRQPSLLILAYETGTVRPGEPDAVG
jgi:hypothetical protein